MISNAIINVSRAKIGSFAGNYRSSKSHYLTQSIGNTFWHWSRIPRLYKIALKVMMIWGDLKKLKKYFLTIISPAGWLYNSMIIGLLVTKTKIHTYPSLQYIHGSWKNICYKNPWKMSLKNYIDLKICPWKNILSELPLKKFVIKTTIII